MIRWIKSAIFSQQSDFFHRKILLTKVSIKCEQNAEITQQSLKYLRIDSQSALLQYRRIFFPHHIIIHQLPSLFQPVLILSLPAYHTLNEMVKQRIRLKLNSYHDFFSKVAYSSPIEIFLKSVKLLAA